MASVSPGGSECREDSLDRFGVMGVRHQQLMQQIRPLLQFYVAHPKAVNQSNAGKEASCRRSAIATWEVSQLKVGASVAL